MKHHSVKTVLHQIKTNNTRSFGLNKQKTVYGFDFATGLKLPKKSRVHFMKTIQATCRRFTRNTRVNFPWVAMSPWQTMYRIARKKRTPSQHNVMTHTLFQVQIVNYNFNFFLFCHQKSCFHVVFWGKTLRQSHFTAQWCKRMSANC